MKHLLIRSALGCGVAVACATANAYTFAEDFEATFAGGAVPTDTSAPFPGFYGPRFPHLGGPIVWGHGNGSEQLADEGGNQFVRLFSDPYYGTDQVYVTLSLPEGTYHFGFDYRAGVSDSLKFSITQTSGAGAYSFSSLLGAAAGWTPFDSSSGVHLQSGTYKLAWKDKLHDGFAGDVDNILVSSVPEPETYAMLLAGLVLAAGVMVARKSLHWRGLQRCV